MDGSRLEQIAPSVLHGFVDRCIMRHMRTVLDLEGSLAGAIRAQSRMGTSRHKPWLLILLLNLIVPVFGQETTGSIAGLVSDPTGAVVPGAQVTVVNVGTNATYKTATNQAGNFTLRTIPVGNYKLMVEASGFKRYEVTNVVTQVNEGSRVDVTMAGGAGCERGQGAASGGSVH